MVETRRRMKMMKHVDGRITRTNSMIARWTRKIAGGLKVAASLKPVLIWRCGRNTAGEPSQVESSRNASARFAGGADRQPINTLSPMTLSGGNIALLPMKE